MCEHCKPLNPARLEQVEAEDFGEEVPPCDWCLSEKQFEAPEAAKNEGTESNNELGRATIEETAELEMSCESATWVVYESLIDRHFCQRHADALMAAVDRGLGQSYRDAGLQRSEDYLAVSESVKCDHVDPPRPGQAKLTSCDQPAAYAHLALERSFVCDEHAGWYSAQSSQQR